MFDLNCSIGTGIAQSSLEWTSLAELLTAMDRHAIDRAVVFHNVAREYHPVYGNSLLLDEIGTNDRLEPSWALVPNDMGRASDADVVDDMVSRGVRVARLFPQEHEFSLAQWCSGRLFAALEVHRVPTILPLSEASHEEIYDVCHAYPDLPVVLSDIRFESRSLTALLVETRNLFVDISFFRTFRRNRAPLGHHRSRTDFVRDWDAILPSRSSHRDA